MRFFTDKQGRVRPISGKSAGGGVVAATVLAGVVAVGGGVGGGAVGSGALEAAAGQSAQLTRSVSGSKRVARRGQQDEAWRRMDLRNLRKKVERAAECAVHSYGQVQEFFLHTPCRELRRVLFVVGDDAGNTMVVSVAWVRMFDSRAARELRTLADVYGTGNVSPIAAVALDAGGVRFSGRHYDSRRDGTLVVIAEAEPVSGRPDAALLDGVTEVAVEFPPP